MFSKSNPAKEIFLRLAGKYVVERNIGNYGYGEGIAYFLYNKPNELLYREELKVSYYDCNYKISAAQEYRYIFEDNILQNIFLHRKIFYFTN